MRAEGTAEYAVLDRPRILERVFHPRRESTWERARSGEVLRIPVAPGVEVGGRFYSGASGDPTLLFFHGNGEIVADYEDLAPAFAAAGYHFLAVDYRGYGISGGSPTVAAMMADCHRILTFTQQFLVERGHAPLVVVAGRSLGSASALELAASRGDELGGLLVESGFAEVCPLLRTLGLDPETWGIREENGFRNVDKIRRFAGPTLVIHGALDSLIPPWNATALYEASPAPSKELVLLPEADHNSVFALGFELYLSAVADLGARLRQE